MLIEMRIKFLGVDFYPQVTGVVLPLKHSAFNRYRYNVIGINRFIIPLKPLRYTL